jgi:hypothetical protein
MPVDSDVLEWLQAWYRARCDARSDAVDGIRIVSVDNPGWSVRIGADLPDVDSKLELFRADASDSDWVVVWVEKNAFRGAGDPSKLGVILRAFMCWTQRGCGLGPLALH